MRALTKICLLGCLSAALVVTAGCGDDASESDGTTEGKQEEWPGTVTLTPEAWKLGNNRGEFTILNDDGTPLEGAQVTVSPWMPAHGHGSGDVELEESEPGLYVTDSLRFNMPGVWELRLYIALGDDKGRLSTSIEVP